MQYYMCIYIMWFDVQGFTKYEYNTTSAPTGKTDLYT